MYKETHIITKCKGCGAKIIFMKSSTGKLVPCNAESVEAEDIFYNRNKHMAHFATCPKADVFRRAKRMKEANDPLRKCEKDEAEYRKSTKETLEKIKNDKRLFVVNNQHAITVPRYALLNLCANSGMDYEQLVSYDNKELLEWMGELGEVAEEKEECLELFA